MKLRKIIETCLYVSDPAWRLRLAELGIAIESDWTWPNGAQSLYFRDPENNSIEITVGATWMLPDV